VDYQLALNRVAKEAKEQSFDKDAEVELEEALGVALSVWSEWDGMRILDVCIAALEDANYSTVAGEIEKIKQAEYERIEAELKGRDFEAELGVQKRGGSAGG